MEKEVRWRSWSSCRSWMATATALVQCDGIFLHSRLGTPQSDAHGKVMKVSWALRWIVSRFHLLLLIQLMQNTGSWRHIHSIVSHPQKRWHGTIRDKQCIIWEISFLQQHVIVHTWAVFCHRPDAMPICIGTDEKTDLPKSWSCVAKRYGSVSCMPSSCITGTKWQEGWWVFWQFNVALNGGLHVFMKIYYLVHTIKDDDATFWI